MFFLPRDREQIQAERLNPLRDLIVDMIGLAVISIVVLEIVLCLAEEFLRA